MKINNFRGELTDISAKKEALNSTAVLCCCSYVSIGNTKLEYEQRRFQSTETAHSFVEF